MPKVPKETARTFRLGAAEDRNGLLGGQTVNFVTIRRDSELANIDADFAGRLAPTR